MYIKNVHIQCRNLLFLLNVHRHVHFANNQQFVTETEASRKTCSSKYPTTEKQITVRDENLNFDLQKGSSTTTSMLSSRTPSFVGPSTELNFVHEAGLPKHITGLKHLQSSAQLN